MKSLDRFFRSLGLEGVQGQSLDWAYSAEEPSCSPLTFILNFTGPECVLRDEELNFRQQVAYNSWQSTAARQPAEGLRQKEAAAAVQENRSELKELRFTLQRVKSLQQRLQPDLAGHHGEVTHHAKEIDDETIDKISSEVEVQSGEQVSILSIIQQTVASIPHSNNGAHQAVRNQVELSGEVTKMRQTVRKFLDKEQANLKAYRLNGAKYQAACSNKLKAKNPMRNEWEYALGHAQRTLESSLKRDAYFTCLDALRYAQLGGFNIQLIDMCLSARQKQLSYLSYALNRSRRSVMPQTPRPDELKARSTEQLKELKQALLQKPNDFHVHLSGLVMEKSREIERLYASYLEALHGVALKATAMQVLLSLLLDDLQDHSTARTADTVRQLRVMSGQVQDVSASAHTNLEFRGLQGHQCDILNSRVRLECFMDTIKLALRSLQLDSSYLPDPSHTFTICRELFHVVGNLPLQLLGRLESEDLQNTWTRVGATQLRSHSNKAVAIVAAVASGINDLENAGDSDTSFASHAAGGLYRARAQQSLANRVLLLFVLSPQELSRWWKDCLHTVIEKEPSYRQFIALMRREWLAS